MKEINPLGRAVLAAALVAAVLGASTMAFADDDYGYGHGDQGHDWQEHHDRHQPPPAYYYQPAYRYAPPPPVVYAPPPPQYVPPVDLFFSIGIR